MQFNTTVRSLLLNRGGTAFKFHPGLPYLSLLARSPKQAIRVLFTTLGPDLGVDFARVSGFCSLEGLARERCDEF